MKKRWGYLAAAAVLLLAEVLIALFVHDRFVRPYLGDVLAVILLYALARGVFPQGHPYLPLYIFLFAVLVELLQYIHVTELLGLSGSRFFRVLIGGVFDWKDILCYGAGCLAAALLEYVRERRATRP